MVNSAIQVDLAQLIALQSGTKQVNLIKRKKIRAQQNGAYLSSKRGRGMDFDETRLYQAGDDMRFMDWRVMARTGRAHTKLFCVERERPVWIILDQSLTMRFGTRKCFKSVAAAELAALFAWAAVQQGDRIGGIIFHDEAIKVVKPQSRKQGILPLLQHIVTINQANPEVTSTKQFEHVCEQIRRLCHPGALVYILSDFVNMTAKAEENLHQLAHHNEVIACFFYDALEAEPPPPGSYQVTNGEQLLLLNTYTAQAREAYRQQFKLHLAKLKKLFQQHQIHFLVDNSLGIRTRPS